ncbi:MAG TPA: tetratricopeptide repeat protein [Candidatus Acidoferrales bacterium]|nr:tetratricopeptide repeat protein [Candidatus Acidoferrales bacterium]
MAVICLLIGVLVGYLVRGSAPVAPAAAPVPSQAAPVTPTGGTQQMPSLDDMKRMADKQAEPLLEKLKADPKNADLLNQVANLYRMTHQFQLAASYYQKSLEANPANVGPRTDLASCLYYQGDVDGALAQLEKSLTYDPKHAGTLLNLGLIRWKGKGDTAGAVAAWKQLLKSNPGFKDRDVVEKLIAEAKAHGNKQTAQKN